MTVWCYPQERIGGHQMRAICRGKVLQDAFLAGLQCLKQYQICSWLSDDRGNGPMPDEDEQWIRTYWFPQAVACGWKNWAVLLPTGAVGKLNVTRFVNENRALGIETQVFEEPTSALEWLRTLSAPISGR